MKPLRLGRDEKWRRCFFESGTRGLSRLVRFIRKQASPLELLQVLAHPLKYSVRHFHGKVGWQALLNGSQRRIQTLRHAQHGIPSSVHGAALGQRFPVAVLNFTQLVMCRFTPHGHGQLGLFVLQGV